MASIEGRSRIFHDSWVDGSNPTGGHLLVNPSIFPLWFIILSMDISRVSWDPQVVADQISACPEDMLVRVTAAWMSRAVDLNQPAKMTGNDRS